jgi:hypothetical protein
LAAGLLRRPIATFPTLTTYYESTAMFSLISSL